MANRSYLFSISNQPTCYADRPETVIGLSEWNYKIPLSYMILASGNTALSASLIALPPEGYANSPEHVEYYALTGNFEIGFNRLKKFLNVLSAIFKNKGLSIESEISETIEFLNENHSNFIYLETVELDMMMLEKVEDFNERSSLYALLCAKIGLAIDSLPDDINEASTILEQACNGELNDSYNCFEGISLNEDFDDGFQDIVIGLSEWSNTLYFDIKNKQAYEQR